MKKPAKYILLSVYCILLIIISTKLFFEDQFNFAISSFNKLFEHPQVQSLTIAYSDPLISLNPLVNDSSSRSRLLHIYEPLIRRNKDLELEPALAVSYGAIDDLTWEFKLRPNVLFHDGTPLAIEDVISSLKKSKDDPSSGVKDLGSNIVDIKKMDDRVLHIITDSPDPLLPQKISSFLIFPAKSGAGSVVGTGPYMLTQNQKNELHLTRFEKYWGMLPSANLVTLKTIASRQDKIKALSDRSVDIIAKVPQDAAKDFRFTGFSLNKTASLEVNFLMFNFDRVFKTSRLRKAVQLTLDPTELSALTQGFSAPVSQFVVKGIFGYDPSIILPKVDIDQASKLVKESMGTFRAKAVLDLPTGLESFGLNVKEKLRVIGFDIILDFLAPKDLEAKIRAHKSDFYFFGWSSDLADSSDFLSAVAHSPSGKYGQFNGGNYRSNDVDQIVEFGQNTIDPERRLQKLREAMKKITLDDIMGIPLFSPETLYGVSDTVSWSPRVDGYVLAQEVKL